MSSTNKTDNYQLSQFVGTDIPSILNDYNGDMRKIDTAIHNASVAGGDNATAIAELQTSTARMNTEIGGINSTVNTLSGKVVGIEGVIPATASEQNKLITAQELPEIPSITELEQDVANISSDVNDIKTCVPSNASASNKLATMADIGGGGEPADYLYRVVTNGETYGELFTAMRNAILTFLGDSLGAERFRKLNQLHVKCGEISDIVLSYTGEIDIRNVSASANYDFNFGANGYDRSGNPCCEFIRLSNLGSSYSLVEKISFYSDRFEMSDVGDDDTAVAVNNREWTVSYSV